jgi:hypothetical protein
VNLIAAACAVPSFSSIEADVSIISTMEIGRFSWVKRLSSCRMPSSNTAKSFWPRVVTKLLCASVTERLRLMISMPVPKIGAWGRAWAPSGAGATTAARPRARRRTVLFIVVRARPAEARRESPPA